MSLVYVKLPVISLGCPPERNGTLGALPKLHATRASVNAVKAAAMRNIRDLISTSTRFAGSPPIDLRLLLVIKGTSALQVAPIILPKKLMTTSAQGNYSNIKVL